MFLWNNCFFASSSFPSYFSHSHLSENWQQSLIVLLINRREYRGVNPDDLPANFALLDMVSTKEQVSGHVCEGGCSRYDFLQEGGCPLGN